MRLIRHKLKTRQLLLSAGKYSLLHLVLSLEKFEHEADNYH